MDRRWNWRATDLSLPRLFRLAGPLGRRMPAGLRDRVLSGLGRALAKRYPAIVSHLATYAGRSIVLAIEDLDVQLALLVGDPIGIRVVTPEQARGCDAAISGPWRVLIALLEGRADGDALFFSRAIAIEGDTDLVLAIRNAIDGAGIDLLNDLAGACAPLAPLLRRAVPAVASAAVRTAQMIEATHRALLGPALTRCEQLSQEVAQVRMQVAIPAQVPPSPSRRRAAAAND